MDTSALTLTRAWFDEHLKAVLNQARQSGHVKWFAKTLAIPPGKWASVFAQFPGFGWFYRSQHGEETRIGLGLAREWQWDDRHLWNRMDEYITRLKQAGLPDDVWIVGGQAFSSRSRWLGWPAVYLALPMVQITESVHESRLTVVLPVFPDTVPETYQRRLEPVWQSMMAEPGGSDPLPQPMSSQSIPSRDAWMALVEEAAQSIRHGPLKKVVLAREVRLNYTASLSLERILDNLTAQNADASAFAIRGPEGVFLGATPELLARVENGTFETMCLAGSAPRGLTPEDDSQYAEGMRNDPKIAAEHQAVIQHVTESLKPWVADLTWPSKPLVKKLPTVQHLLTPVRGRLVENGGIWPVITDLQPTPAVAGYPVDAATRYILACEPFSRGWYAGTVGWANLGGDAEWMVALRSAWLRDATVSLYAGCGIMGDSVASSELRESDWKLNTMLSALELEGGAW